MLSLARANDQSCPRPIHVIVRQHAYLIGVVIQTAFFTLPTCIFFKHRQKTLLTSPHFPTTHEKNFFLILDSTKS